MRTLLVMTIAVLLAVSFAQATVIATHDGGTPVASLPGYTGYVVSLVSDTANDPAGFDATLPGQGFNGPMNQIMAFGALATPTLTNANLIGAPFGLPAEDSHFLFLDAELIIPPGAGPNETAIYLGGAFGVVIASRSNPLPLALIVIQGANTVQLTAMGGDASGATFPVSLLIPEPLTLTLLCVGGLALIRRRR